MSAADIQQRRAGLPWVPGLLWTGVGLAPVAALLVLLVGDNASLVRFAVLLAIIAVALIGSAMVLRRSESDAIRDELEDMLVEELDVLRDDVREDITTAARATHKAFGERVVTLQQSVETLRGEVENLRVRVERGGVPTQRVAPPVPSMPPPPPTTSVRHTETVKVTRQTIVDQNDGGRDAGTVYGSNRVGQEPVVPAQRRPERETAQPHGAVDANESWSERLLRQRLGEQSGGSERHDEPRYDEPRYDEPRYDEPRYDEPRYDEPRYGVDRSGAPAWSREREDAWRAAVRADQSGTEYRVEGRWAAVRRDENPRPEPYGDPGRAWERGSDSGTYRSRETQRGWDVGPAQEPWSATRPALPATSSEPSASSWLQGWEARPEPIRRREPDEEYPWSGPARSPRATGYDTGEERWR